jgi:hypothetical protein
MIRRTPLPGLEVLARSRTTLTPATQEMTPDNDLQALSA